MNACSLKHSLASAEKFRNCQKYFLVVKIMKATKNHKMLQYESQKNLSNYDAIFK